MVTADLEPAKVRQALADLDHEREVQQGVVNSLADLLDAAERTLTAIDRRLTALRENSAVRDALAGHTEQAIGQRDRYPGEPWTWLESIAGGSLVDGIGTGMTVELARDGRSGRVYIAPLGTPPPDGPGWLLGQLVIP
ncbi:MAG: hypothetical protein ACJ768_25510 [Gaiellaceae bacterium]